jgi:hypothetical protein
MLRKACGNLSSGVYSTADVWREIESELAAEPRRIALLYKLWTVRRRAVSMGGDAIGRAVCKALLGGSELPEQ